MIPKSRLSKPSMCAPIAFALLLIAGCTSMQNRPNVLAPGSMYVSAVRSTGSFGNVNAEQRSRVVGERTWQGRKVFVYDNTTTGGSLITDHETGRWIAFARGDTPTMSWEPAIGWDFPLEVGKSWSRKHRLTNHANKSVTEYEGHWKVEAYEDVTVRAGTFKAYKVAYTDSLGTETATWFSPEFGLFVKNVSRRSSKHPAGVGTNETELVQRPTLP